MKNIYFITLLLINVQFLAQNTNNSLRFDGVDDYVNINSLSTPMASLQSFTVEFTIKADLNQQTSSIRTSMFSINTSSGDNRLLMILGGAYAQDGKLMIYDEYSWGINASYVSNVVVGDNECHKISFSYSSGLAKVYLDGALIGSFNTNFNLVATDLYSLGQEWDVSNTGPSTSQFYNGYIDDFRIWESSLTSQEVLLYLDSNLTGAEPNLLVNYNFNQGAAGGANQSIITLSDHASNIYDGNLHYFQLANQASNWVINPCFEEVVIYESACDSFQNSNGNILYNSGLYIDSFINSQGVDSIVLLNLTINNSDTSSINIVACDGYYWVDSLYKNNGSYTKLLINQNGCDSLVILNLTLNYSDSVIENIVTCDSYYWIDSLYGNSGVYTKELINQQGCDSVVTLNLTLNSSDSIVENVIACNNYYWIDSLYESSGVYTKTLINQQGCDSTLVLDLTINNSDTSIINIVACDGYYWVDSLYKNNGSYTKLLINQNGCDSLIILNLTLNYSDSVIENIVTCDSYYWIDSLYGNSGVYIKELINQQGCDSVVTLNLILNSSDSIVENVIACNNYYWIDSLYESSGVYTKTLINQQGCDSTLVLDLTILDTVYLTQNICDSIFVDSNWNSISFVDTTVSYEANCEQITITNYDISICSINLHVPNVFSPNGDGINDSFKITTNGVLIKENGKIEIYNRWGTIVFKSSKEIDWNGDGYSSGVYYYIFNYLGESYSGTITLFK
jgi:gliding motility-associated-like protein